LYFINKVRPGIQHGVTARKGVDWNIIERLIIDFSFQPLVFEWLQVAAPGRVVCDSLSVMTPLIFCLLFWAKVSWVMQREMSNRYFSLFQFI
jgi:hypothetical protein